MQIKAEAILNNYYNKAIVNNYYKADFFLLHKFLANFYRNIKTESIEEITKLSLLWITIFSKTALHNTHQLLSTHAVYFNVY